jgi:apolipoprotein N-acyltransferase
MELNPSVISIVIAGLELAAATGLEVRLIAALCRRPRSKTVAVLLGGLALPNHRSWAGIALLAMMLALFQIAPLSREGIVGNPAIRDHISGVAVIVGELLLSIWLWIGTLPQKPAD